MTLPPHYLRNVFKVKSDAAMALTITPKGKGVSMEDFLKRVCSWAPPKSVKFAFLLPELSPDNMAHGHGIAYYKALEGYPLNVPSKHRSKELVILLKAFNIFKEKWLTYISKKEPTQVLIYDGQWNRLYISGERLRDSPQTVLSAFGFEIIKS